MEVMKTDLKKDFEQLFANSNGNLNYIANYLYLISQNKFKEAETFRTSIFPRKLIKFISLGENEAENEKKFKTLEEKKIWISNVTTLNDPYEFKSLYLDEDKLKSLRFPENIIANLKKILDRNMKKIGISSLSQNSYDSLPMWAYYTNNYAGYCVEYEVVDYRNVYRVCYESERIPIASILLNYIDSVEEAFKSGEEYTPEFAFYATILMSQFYIKHNSWSHEKEYRIIYPVDHPGENIPLSSVGLKTSRIVAGYKCKKEYIDRLQAVSDQLSCGRVRKVQISPTKYTLLEEPSNDQNETGNA